MSDDETPTSWLLLLVCDDDDATLTLDVRVLTAATAFESVTLLDIWLLTAVPPPTPALLPTLSVVPFDQFRLSAPEMLSVADSLPPPLMPIDTPACRPTECEAPTVLVQPPPSLSCTPCC